MIDPHEQTEIPHDLYCQQCGYNLRGLTSNRCPECGESVESLRSQVSQIPWVHRKSIGSFRAYWRTVWWVSFKYKRFCEEVARPVEYRDSQLFRWITILHVWIPFIAVIVYAQFVSGPITLDGDSPDSLFEVVWPTAVLSLLMLILAVLATGMPSWFFDDRKLPVKQRNSAVAMSYYCCGSLAWLFTSFVAAVLIGQAGEFSENAEIFMILLAVFLPIWPLMAWWFDLIHTSRRTLPHRPRRAVAVALMVPPLWLFAVVLTLILIVIGGYVVLMLMSVL